MSNVQLSFSMQHQVHTNWCWAATAASVSKYYDANSVWSQCKVAAQCQHLPCCSIPTPVGCNVPWFLDNALGITGNFDFLQGSSLNFVDIRTQINAQRPIGVRVGWASGGGHFVIIHGYNDTDNVLFLHVQDPIYGTNYVELNEFTHRYLSSGSWTHSYFTRQNLGGNMLAFTDIDADLLTRAKSLTPELMLNDTGYQSKRFAFPKNRNIPMALPHDVYVINFNSLRSGATVPTYKLVGTRLIDQTPNGYLTYEFDSIERNAKLKQVFKGQTFNDNFVEAFNQAVTLYEPSLNQYQVRILRQPELKMEVLWLFRSANLDDSIYIPIYEGEILEKGRIYSNSDFNNLLIEGANNLHISDDPLIGG